MTVEDLFYNTPARKKFKALGTEIAHLAGTIERLALSGPRSRSRSPNGRARLSTPGTGLLETIASLTAPGSAHPAPRRGCGPALPGLGLCRGTVRAAAEPVQVFLAINGRTIQSAPLAGAVKAGFGTLLPIDRHPVAASTLELDTALVDVNVHPAKRQVRLSREPEVLAAVSTAVATALDTLRPVPVSERAPVSPAPSNYPVAGSSGAFGVAEPALAYGRRTTNGSGRRHRPKPRRVLRQGRGQV